ncbi:MAG TPA: hypothetical protein VMT63_10865 [Bacteroidales bacterium]|nr:hypothetical protein [Bacteroidales bacterium]
MKHDEIKDLITKALNDDDPATEARRKLEEVISYDFSGSFREKIADRIFSAGVVINREVEFIRSWNNAFMRIALTGVAAIVILVISLYLINGSFSVNSILGLNDSYDESIVCLLTGN